MHFKDFLHNSAKAIDLELESFFKEWNKDVAQISPRLLPYKDALLDSCRGGKRIRGALVMLGYEMANGKWRMANGISGILKVAAAYEIFQAAILGHDDIIDKSLLRRGKPSLYSKFGGEHTGISKAICLGDIGFFLAFKLIASSDFPDRAKNKALEVFSDGMLKTGIGELMDVELSTSGESGRLDEIVEVYKLKTAHYTITTPLVLGAILGGGENGQIKALRNFGQNLGIAFQIQDDISDIFSDKKKLGKDPGGDIKEGKETLLYLFAKERSSKEQKKVLKSFYGNFESGQGEIERVKEILQETGALLLAEEEAERYAKRASAEIDVIIENKMYRDMLSEMTEYFIK